LKLQKYFHFVNLFNINDVTKMLQLNVCVSWLSTKFLKINKMGIKKSSQKKCYFFLSKMFWIFVVLKIANQNTECKCKDVFSSE